MNPSDAIIAWVRQHRREIDDMRYGRLLFAVTDNTFLTATVAHEYRLGKEFTIPELIHFADPLSEALPFGGRGDRRRNETITGTSVGFTDDTDTGGSPLHSRSSSLHSVA